jgi:hypothetical protein
VIRAFEQGIESGEMVAADEAENQEKVKKFIFFSGIFFEGWNLWPAEQRMAGSIAIVNLLPEATNHKIGMRHGYHTLPRSKAS